MSHLKNTRLLKRAAQSASCLNKVSGKLPDLWHIGSTVTSGSLMGLPTKSSAFKGTAFVQLSPAEHVAMPLGVSVSALTLIVLDVKMGLFLSITSLVNVSPPRGPLIPTVAGLGATALEWDPVFCLGLQGTFPVGLDFVGDCFGLGWSVPGAVVFVVVAVLVDDCLVTSFKAELPRSWPSAGQA